jgi:hypothetical protein
MALGRINYGPRLETPLDKIKERLAQINQIL